ncbi:hypothetical protein ACFCV3_29130 [Kribbella sp. NPDC056345]
MPAPKNKPWLTDRRPTTPGANWTSGGAYRHLPTAEPRPDPRPQRTTT